jgi:hypothetical protein
VARQVGGVYDELVSDARPAGSTAGPRA